jgi:hypothetical protein
MDLDNIHIGLHILGILLLIYLIYIESSESEHIANADVPRGIGSFNTHVYTSGATMRVIGQTFSSSNQGVRMRMFSTENPSDIYTITVHPITERISNADVPRGLRHAGNLYTSGATMRVLGQAFSSSNQGRRAILHNSDDPNHEIPVVIKVEKA